MTRTLRNAFFYAATVAFGGFVFGLDAAVISGTVRFIATEWNLSDMQVGAVVSAPGLGVLFALLLAGWVCDRFGRKKALLLIAALYLVSAVGSAFAPSFELLVAARFLGGLAFTSLSVASMYIGEIAPPRWRGKLVSMNQLNIVVGLSAAYFVNYLIVQASQSGGSWVTTLGIDQYSWRWMLGSEVLPVLLWLALLLFIPESPRWLVFNGRVQDARRVLAKVVESQDEITAEIRDIEESMHRSHDSRSIGAQLRELMSKRMRLVFLIGLTIGVVQQVTGINAILFYAPTVFEQLGIGTDAAFLQAVWVGVVSVLATSSTLLLIDRVGRRPMALWGLVWLISSLLVCSYGFNQARYTLTEASLAEIQGMEDPEALRPLIGVTFESDTEFKNALKGVIGETRARDEASLFIEKAATINAPLILGGILSFIAAFQFSIGPVMWVLFSEIFPTAVRGVAIPAFAFIASVLSYLIQQFFPWQLAVFGASAVLISYAVMSTIGLIALIRLLPETKNKTIEEIERALAVEPNPASTVNSSS